ncbi:MAG: methylated-DNA--[protein]-cysteine S-methyltransferase [Rhodospirillales bacterium]|nr:methylated-DNA--[protein]-cysteine S-methyltransferase [Rhodospirillales bacterium]MDH3909905.1 methylated-DNA--[protein]-cysteine S-methyltransferase [Rhodospirillales bacterium]MDH3919932.1 methylated-DNA--[protein]-cysteine S-methyltransferase [Rhodospirillales bacterium]MDH3967336.1 methylated-DNA--[protein]-cysteine S-methyltransferase [Rhodospirillales bacterium]
MHYSCLDSPVGRLLLAGDEAGLRLICFPSEKRTTEPGWRRDDAPFTEAVRQLEAYFAGELSEFDLTLAPKGTTFQLSVWQALRRIPYGETVSYGEVARAIGRPTASRAVGAANGSNPLPIVIPCHRVIGSTGKLTGFGGGLDTKAALLALERRGRGGVAEQTAFSFVREA